jgi:hypothetical protein
MFENDSDIATLLAVIETAADAIDTDGVIRLLCELTDARKAVARKAEAVDELLALNDRLIAAIDKERDDYTRVLAQREQEITDVRDMLDVMTDERAYWKRRANQLADRMAAEVQSLLVGDPLVFAAREYQNPANGDAARKINAIKELRRLTGLGLLQSKLAVEQVIKIIEMKEATD